MSVLTAGISAAVCLYLGVAFIAEPLHGFAATTGNTAVSVQVMSTSSMTCSATTSITTSTGSTATDTSTYGTGGTMATCVLITNNSLGYTLKWQITTGSGGFGTGHLDGNNVTGVISTYCSPACSSQSPAADTVLAYKPATAGTPEPYSAPNGNNPNTSSRWAARIKSASTTNGGAGLSWGTDGSSERFLNVGTGAAVSLVSRVTETSATGDVEYIQFKANIGALSAQRTGSYKTTVSLTEVDN